MKQSKSLPLTRRKRQEVERSLHVTETARVAALFCGSLAAITVEVTRDSMHLGGGLATHQLSFAAACPVFVLSLLCFERMNQTSWFRSVETSWPWFLMIVWGIVALTLRPHWPFLVLLIVVNFILDKLVMRKKKALQLTR